jgi:hypothetical protein
MRDLVTAAVFVLALTIAAFVVGFVIGVGLLGIHAALNLLT